MGFNQHTRGTLQMNKLIWFTLLGKQAKPGSGAFRTGQPSACGTAREVGTFSQTPS